MAIDRDTVIRLAREATNSGDGSELVGDAVERFAQLVFLEAAHSVSAVPTAQKYDDVLLPFVSLMRKELHANSRKGDRPGWLAIGANAALLEVYWHTAKLSAAVKNNDGPAIMEHSADVANMALMVLDICGGLAWVEADVSGVETSAGGQQ